MTHVNKNGENKMVQEYISQNIPDIPDSRFASYNHTE
jgi:hypothetical protein